MFVQIPGSHHPGTRLCLIPGFRDPGSILILEQVTQYGNPYLICITVSFKDCTITYFWLIVTEVHEEFSTYCILIYSQSILPLTSCQCARQWSPSRRPYNNTNWYQADIQDFLVLVYNVGASNESKATLFCLFCLCAQNHSYFFSVTSTTSHRFISVFENEVYPQIDRSLPHFADCWRSVVSAISSRCRCISLILTNHFNSPMEETQDDTGNFSNTKPPRTGAPTTE